MADDFKIDQNSQTAHSPRSGSVPMNFTNTLPFSRRELLGETISKRRGYLEMDSAQGSHNNIEIVEKDTTVGRSPDCTVQLQLNNISRVHAKFCMENGEYIVEDFACTNGSFVNGIQISRCILKDGDVIEVGEAKFHFYEEKVRQK